MTPSRRACKQRAPVCRHAPLLLSPRLPGVQAPGQQPTSRLLATWVPQSTPSRRLHPCWSSPPRRSWRSHWCATAHACLCCHWGCRLLFTSCSSTRLAAAGSQFCLLVGPLEAHDDLFHSLTVMHCRFTTTWVASVTCTGTMPSMATRCGCACLSWVPCLNARSHLRHLHIGILHNFKRWTNLACNTLLLLIHLAAGTSCCF